MTPTLLIRRILPVFLVIAIAAHIGFSLYLGYGLQ